MSSQHDSVQSLGLCISSKQRCGGQLPLFELTVVEGLPHPSMPLCDEDFDIKSILGSNNVIQSSSSLKPT